MEDAADARLATFRALMESRFETVREMLGDLEDEPASGAAAPDRDVAARLEAVMASAQSGVEALEELARAQAAGFAAVQACQARLEDGQTRLSDGLGGAPGGAASAALHERLAEIAAAFERSPTAAPATAPATAPASSDRPIDALHDRLAALETRLDAAAIAADRQAEALGELSQALSLDRLAILADQAAERHEATERATRIARRIVDLAPMAATKQKAGS
jgi:exonuclease VII small subunit